MELEELINRCLAKKDNSKEFALWFLPDGSGGTWKAAIGNECPAAMLGEVDGDVEARGATAIEAVQNLLEAIP